VNVRITKSEVDGVIEAPPSKSYTHRAFIAAALSKKSVVRSPLIAEDTVATLNACKKMGAKFLRKSNEFRFWGTNSISPGYYYAANSGTTFRILMGLLSLSNGISLLDGDESLRKRPNRELAKALIKLGATVIGDGRFRPPLRIRGVIRNGEIEIEALSSQFVTSLLFALPLTDGDSVLTVRRIKSRPYIDITLHVLESSGVEIRRDGNTFYIKPSEFDLRRFVVPPDFSSMSYLIAAGILGGKVVINNAVESKQGDKIFVDLVKEMGGKISWKGNKIIAEKSKLSGIDFDASDTPDIVPTVAVLAATANGITKIYNAEHLRIKEIDRIKGIAVNLRSLGVDVKELRDGLIIRGGEIRGGTVDSFGDHRMAMAFSLLGIVSEVIVKNAEVVNVSYPGFFEDLKKIGVRVERC